MAEDIQTNATPEQFLAQARAAAEAGRLEDAVNLLRELIAGGQQASGPVLARACELQGRCELGLLRNVQAMMSFREAELTFDASGMKAEGAYCRLMQVRKLLDDKQLKLAQQHLESAIQSAQAFNWRDAYLLGREFMGLLKLHAREFRQAAELLDEVLDDVDSRKLSWEPLLIKLSLTNCYFSLGNRDRALELLANLADDPRFSDIPRLSIYTLMNLGYQSYLMRERSAAREYFTSVLRLVGDNERQPRAFGWLGVMARYNLGQLSIDDGDYEEAVTVLLEVLEYTANHGYQQLLAGGLLALAVAEILSDRPARALLHAQLSQHYVMELGDIETNLSRYVLALAHLAGNRPAEARSYWRDKSELEDHLETSLHYSWMIKILEHLTATGAGAPCNLDSEAIDLARDWLAEIEGLRTRQAATPS